MGEIIVREVDAEEALRVLPSIRQSDVEEAMAAGEESVESALIKTLYYSDVNWLSELDGEPITLGGVCPVNLLQGVGAPWMVATDALVKHRGAFMRISPGYIQRMLDRYPTLQNCVHAKNTPAMRWLHRVGFEFSHGFLMPGTREPFYWFGMERS